MAAVQDFHRCRAESPEASAPASHEQRMQIYRIVNGWNGDASSPAASAASPPASDSLGSAPALFPTCEIALERVSSWITHTGTTMLRRMAASGGAAAAPTTPGVRASAEGLHSSVDVRSSAVSAVGRKDFLPRPEAAYPRKRRPATPPSRPTSFTVAT
jgi:hypothetical protein